MKIDYIVACGVAWRKTADPVAGWELVEGLQSEDQEVSLLAQTLLSESGEASMSLLENAVATGYKSRASWPVHGRDSALPRRDRGLGHL